jgi:hypothetical protein
MSNKQRLLGLVGLGRSDGSHDEDRKLREKLENKGLKLADVRRRLKVTKKRLGAKDREIEALRARLAAEGGAEVAGIDPGRVVWIFCTGRSGSTWLASMMGDIEGHAKWNEPLVGKLFGEFYYESAAHKTGHAGIMGQPHIGVALKSIRSLVLEGAASRYPLVSEQGGYVVIKEPHGSIGAPLLIRALPESRMVLLVRDPRDVVSSALDGQKKGSWTSKGRRWRDREKPLTLADTDPDAFVKQRAEVYLRDIGKSKEAYETHQGRKVLIHYEDLRADTLNVMSSIYSELEIPVDEEELSQVVEKHRFENIPEEERGQGKFHRKATPGGWREDLTPAQVRTVEETNAPLLDEFYPGWRDRKDIF